MSQFTKVVPIVTRCNMASKFTKCVFTMKYIHALLSSDNYPVNTTVMLRCTFNMTMFFFPQMNIYKLQVKFKYNLLTQGNIYFTRSMCFWFAHALCAHHICFIENLPTSVLQCAPVSFFVSSYFLYVFLCI